MTSPHAPSAVPPPEGVADQGVPWHYGDPHREQRRLVEAGGVVDISNRGVVTVSGPDRLTWLNDLTTQRVDALAPGDSALTLILSPHGHVEFELHVIDDGGTAWLITAPGSARELVDYLRSMQFLLRVDITDVSDEMAVVWEPIAQPDAGHPTFVEPADYLGTGHVDAGSDRGGDASKYVPHRPAPFVGREVIVARADLVDRLASAEPAGTWALEALRTAAGVPRVGLETDHRTLPHEVGWIGAGVHLAKGCYRGQEAVARVHNLGHPPRRLVLLHLDGSADVLPGHGDVVLHGDREVGFVGTPARHYELGPIATAIIKRSVPIDAPLVVRASGGDVPAAQEVVVAP